MKISLHQISFSVSRASILQLDRLGVPLAAAHVAVAILLPEPAARAIAIARPVLLADSNQVRKSQSGSFLDF